MEKKSILIVDDSPDIVNILKIRLEKEGYRVVSASDGEEMLQVLGEVKPDLIILDIMLPKMDGYSALLEMRKREAVRDTPVIVLSAKRKENMEELFAMEGVNYFIEKPYNAGELLEKIKAIING